MLGNAGFVITWNGAQLNGDIDIFFQLFDTDGNVVGGEYRVTNDVENDQQGPTVDSDSIGNFAIVWQTDLQDGSMSEIFGRRFGSSGNPIGNEFHINTYSIGDQSEPDIAMSPTGKFAVVWMSYAQDGSEYGVYGRLYDSNGDPVTNEFQVNTHTESDQFFPKVSMDESGNFIIVWVSRGQDAGLDGIYGQRYNSDGQPIGDEFQVNAPYIDHAIAPAVAMFNQGRFVVTWDAAAPSIFGDVLGQRFNGQTEPRGREAW